MSQISPPVRILLIGAVVFLAAWFTVLRPKPATIEPVTTTPPPANVTQPKAATAATTAPAAKPEATASGVPAEALAKLPKDVARALEAKKVLVLGVFSDDAKHWRPMADDDRYVRNELRRTNRYDGSVFVKQVGISKLSTYGPLVNELHVNQSPSIVVIDANLKGTVLTGYADRVSINQAIADAHDASVEPDIKDAYLRKANEICGGYSTAVGRHSWPTVPGPKAKRASLERLLNTSKRYSAMVKRTPAPTKWRGLKAHWLRVMADDERAVAAVIKNHQNPVAVVTALNSVDSRDVAKLDQRFNAAGLTRCALNRRS